MEKREIIEGREEKKGDGSLVLSAWGQQCGACDREVKGGGEIREKHRTGEEIEQEFGG